ncbi:hypothetical protein DUZ99_03970 [Xylanibacillus composti]|nr:hypothetical protein [Xylanibacillus composti]
MGYQKKEYVRTVEKLSKACSPFFLIGRSLCRNEKKPRSTRLGGMHNSGATCAAPFMGEEKPDEELMGKRKSSPRLSAALSCRYSYNVRYSQILYSEPIFFFLSVENVVGYTHTADDNKEQVRMRQCESLREARRDGR